MENPDGIQALIEAGFDYDFWIAIAAGVYAFASEYIGQNPKMKDNTVYQLLGTLLKGTKK